MKGSKKVVDSIRTMCGELWEIVHRSLSVRPGFRNARMQVSLVAEARITLLCNLCKNTASVEIIVS